MGLRLALASIRILALSLNILGGILLRMKNMSMILIVPIRMKNIPRMITRMGNGNFTGTLYDEKNYLFTLRYKRQKSVR